MRTIPSTMATQHPDNAYAPYWDKRNDPFIAAYQESKESVICFRDLGTSEYMWDWEGKHADASVIDKLFTEHYEYFSEHALGKDKYLTFRLPNIWEEKGYSLLQAMSVILSSEDFARDLGFKDRPLFEVILPMTEKADQLIHMHKLFQKLADFKSHEFSTDLADNNSELELIPLVESIESQQAITGLLKDYTKLYKKNFGRVPSYIRPFFARSDPALVSGLLATTIANKLALARAYEFSEESSIPVFPIAGVGSLPFRGGLSPGTIDSYLAEYPGMRTVTIQSSFRYDYPLAKVKAAIAKLESHMPRTEPLRIDRDKQERLAAIARQAAKVYQSTLRGLAPDMKSVFASVPKRRERRQHIGLLAYGRSMGEQKLPRAITFTAGFYSLGVPPELIGFGRTLAKLPAEDVELLKDEYKSMLTDLDRAGRYLNIDNLQILARRNKAWKQVQADVENIENILGLDFRPRSHIEKAHKNYTSNVLLMKNNPQLLPGLIAQTARVRRSLG
jgi:phosphoenolpyruvate carboxylase